jgi:hypothetical protein
MNCNAFESKFGVPGLRNSDCCPCPKWGGSLQPPAHAGSSHTDFSTLKMEAIRSSETSVHTRSTRRHIPEDGILLAFKGSQTVITKLVETISKLCWHYNECISITAVVCMFSNLRSTCYTLRVCSPHEETWESPNGYVWNLRLGSSNIIYLQSPVSAKIEQK